MRRKSVPDLIDPFVEYCRIRLADDPHLWASTLLDELQPLGYGGSYQSLTAAIRRLGLRPACVACHAAKGRDVAIIDHPPGAETQFDWVELPDPRRCVQLVEDPAAPILSVAAVRAAR